MSSILWRCLRWPGHESARIVRHGDSWRLEGVGAFAQDQTTIAQLRYTIDCDGAWVTQRARVEGWAGDRRIDVSIEAKDGRWTFNGAPVTGVTGCADIDLNFSPSTNLLPIRRLGLAIGDSATVRAAWLRYPSFVLEPLEQTYERVAEDTYDYRSGSFEASLNVSAEGFVLDYAGLWVADNVE